MLLLDNGKIMQSNKYHLGEKTLNKNLKGRGIRVQPTVPHLRMSAAAGVYLVVTAARALVMTLDIGVRAGHWSSSIAEQLLTTTKQCLRLTVKTAQSPRKVLVYNC